MKNLLFLVIALSICAFLKAQQPFSKKQLEIKETVEKMFRALSSRDSIALKSYCSTDITLYEYGQIWNMDTLIKKGITMNQSADFRRVNSFDFIAIDNYRTIAWVTYRLHSVVTKDENEIAIQWLETVVLERQKKRWKVKHLHSTLIKRS